MRSIISDRSVTSAIIAARFTGISDHDIESGISAVESVESACAWAVVIGVFIEIIPDLLELLYHYERQVLPSVIGGVMVGLGVAGEIRFGNIARAARDALSERNKRKISELNLLAEQERTKRAKIEVLLVARKPSAGLTEAMRAFAGTAVMFTVGDDQESRNLCSWLEALLTSAGWRSRGMTQCRLTLPECVMISLPANEWYRQASTARQAAVALGDWLNADGIITAPEFRGIRESAFTGLIINVGARPSTLTAFDALRDGWRWTLGQLIVR